MLEVLKIESGRPGPTVDGDEHVPVMISWGLTETVVWQLMFPDGRLCCEIIISKLGGRVFGVTVLNPPQIASEPEELSDAWVDYGVPVVSLAQFDPNPDLAPQRQVFRIQGSPSWMRAGGWVEFRFGDFIPMKWAISGSVGFGIDDQDRLVAVRVSESALPGSLRLRG